MDTILIKLNDHEVLVPAGSTILEAAALHGMAIPSLYYKKGLVDKDTSGVCIAEVNGEIVPAECTIVTKGMEIITASPSLISARIEALTKIVAIHDYDCDNCVRNNNCELQSAVQSCGLKELPGLPKDKLIPLDTSSAVFIRDNNKCIRCGHCARVCGQMQNIGAVQALGEGLDTQVGPTNNVFSGTMGMGSIACVSCGQCIINCPVGALTEKDNTADVAAAIADPDRFVVVQIAPSVRAALGESLGLPLGVDVESRMAAVLRRLGFDRVFDTKFSADLTIMEEAYEFIDRVQNGGVLPMITSCCPGWVKFCENFYPHMTDHLSTCKSPQQMFGAVAKSYYAEKMGIPKEKMVVVSVMPCTAKKFELTRKNQSGASVPDVDISITTRELARMIKNADLHSETMDAEPYDDPLGLGTGAGVIFGASGGVMEAALRTAVEKLTGKTLDKLEFCDVRGIEGVKEVSYEVNGMTLKVAVASGLANAKSLMDKINNGEVDYHFVEIMACPGGCVNGGGQPYVLAKDAVIKDIRKIRAEVLYRNDKSSTIRKSHENPAIIDLYKDYLGQPGSEKAHTLLHTTYVMRSGAEFII